MKSRSKPMNTFSETSKAGKGNLSLVKRNLPEESKNFKRDILMSTMN
jgi:hypothetical protein